MIIYCFESINVRNKGLEAGRLVVVDEAVGRGVVRRDRDVGLELRLDLLRELLAELKIPSIK